MDDQLKLQSPIEKPIPAPMILSLADFLAAPAEKITPLENPDFVAQGEMYNYNMDIVPSAEQIQDFLTTRGLTTADHRKYLDIVSRVHSEGRVAMEISEGCSLQEILTFCTATIWMVTGQHDETKAEYMLAQGGRIMASQLVDLDNPPITKCSFFNSAFTYLFEAACAYFKREDLLEKYQMISIRRPTHLYIGLVSQYNGGYQITAIDPYHTFKNQDPNKLYAQLDKTQERMAEIEPAFRKAFYWKRL